MIATFLAPNYYAKIRNYECTNRKKIWLFMPFECIHRTPEVVSHIRAAPIFKVEEIQQDATVCRYLFTAKLLYMFRASNMPIRTSIVPIIRST